MEKIILSEFLNINFANFALYKILTQIPNALDGLTVTQRKVIWVLLGRAGKRHKTAQLYSYLLNDTLYVHGNMSSDNTTSNLAAAYKNNLNLLVPYGSFGYRTNPSPAQPRYTEVAISKIAQAIFDPRDLKILKTEAKQVFEGKEIEPYFLLPIIPLAIINGNSGIAVGYSSNILGRNPVDIINILLAILRREIKTLQSDQLKPWIPYFQGEVTPGEKDRQWIFRGKFIRHPKNRRIVTVVDVPPGYSKESYETRVLEPLQEEGIIREWKDSSKKNQFVFEIKFASPIDKLADDKLYELLGLVTKQSENLTFIDYSGGAINLLTFENILEYFRFWIKKRLHYYKIRKQNIISELELRLRIVIEQARFIQYVIDDKVVIERRSKIDIIKQLEKHDFYKHENSYDYLLNMKIYNLSQEKIEELQGLIERLRDELEKTQSTSEEEMWIEDLEKVKPLIEKEVAEKSV